MHLYLVYRVCSTQVIAAYWADILGNVIDAYQADGISPNQACTVPASPEQAALYHGPDFDGRKAYCVTPRSGDSFFIAADAHADAVSLAESFVGSMDFHLEWLLETEAAELLEPGWDQ